MPQPPAPPDRTPRIVRSVRVDGRLYKPGEEDALAAAVTPRGAEQLRHAGKLAGDWSHANATPKG